MEINILIKWLDDIDHKLKNMWHKEEKSFVGKMSGVTMTLPPVTKCRYNAEELTTMYERKSEIINELNKRGVVSDDGWKEYMLSENPEFTPKLNVDSEDIGIAKAMQTDETKEYINTDKFINKLKNE